MSIIFNTYCDHFYPNISFEEDKGENETSYFLLGTKACSEAIPQNQPCCPGAVQTFAILLSMSSTVPARG